MRGKMHMAAPLPFVGQKRMFAKEYIKILPQFNDKTVFVDLRFAVPYNEAFASRGNCGI